MQGLATCCIVEPKYSWVKDSQSNFGMDDTNKVVAHFKDGSESGPHPFASEVQAAQRKSAAPKPALAKQTSTDDKALERWFDQQCGKKRAPKRLEIPNELLVTSGGPLRTTGNITLIDEDGSVTHANNLNHVVVVHRKTVLFAMNSTWKLNFWILAQCKVFQTGNP